MTYDQIGCPKSELDTPVLCLDLDKMDGNVRRVLQTCRAAAVGWRPHAKCHKSTNIARRLVEAGALGITCAKLGEAEVMAAAGMEDILIANLIAGPKKLKRLVTLRQRCNVIVCVDHPDQVAALAQAMQSAGLKLRVLVEVDIGMQRAGVPPGEAALALARCVHDAAGLTLSGVMGYEGHLLQIPNPDEKQRRITGSLDQLVSTAECLRSAGLPCPIVSCGGTGSYQYSVHHPGITEIQAGGAIFMDQFYRTLCHVSGLEQALTVLATVVSCPAADRAITDAGRKTMDQQLCMPHVLGRPGVSVNYLSAEHGVLQLEPDAEPLHIGQRLEFVPGYVDFTTVLHDTFHVIQHNSLAAVWPLDARGRLR